MDKVTAGAAACAGASHKTLRVTNGAASVVGENDTRTGTVAADGSLTMSGYVGVAPKAAPATVTGQFSKDGFHGTSKISVVNCEYEWTLKKT